jgi:pyruvate dehydrogenase E1 component alpha subunit
LSQVYLYWYGNERSNFLAPETYHTLPVAIPVGSQPVHAVGLAYAEKMKRSERIALTFMGEGATSQGVVHEAFNLAGVWQVGVVFYIQNNQWAISLPTSRQTASSTLAEKAFGYGYEGIRLDGNDLFAVYAGVKMATRVAREKGNPVLIEGYTYRLGAHTTSDDPDRYRDSSEVEVWLKRDPLIRLEKYLLSQGWLSEADCDDVREEAKAEAKRAFEEAESTPDPRLEDTFNHVFAALPVSLRNQLEKRKNGWPH